MATTYPVRLAEIVGEHSLVVIHASRDFDTILLTTADVNRPGLQLAGYYDYFDPNWLQLVGKVEITFINSMSPDARLTACRELMRRRPVALVVCHEEVPPPELVQAAREFDVTLMRTDTETSVFMAQIITSLTAAVIFFTHDIIGFSFGLFSGEEAYLGFDITSLVIIFCIALAGLASALVSFTTENDCRMNYSNHNSRFDWDEKAMSYGIQAELASIIKFFEK